MPRYCYVYVLRSLVDYQLYVGLTRDLPARVNLHNRGRVSSTKKRAPLSSSIGKVACTKATPTGVRST